MVRRIRFAALMALAVPAIGGAQISRAPRGGYQTEPGYWVGVSYGFLDGITLNDGQSNSTWQFAYSSQLRATLEKSLGSGVTAGVSAGFASPKLVYTGRAIGTVCGSCEASADVSQYLAFVRVGGGPGFHALFNLEGGVTEFSKFRDRTSGANLDPSSAAYDFTFGFGGGFAYGFSRNTDVYINEQMDLLLHHQGDTGAQSSSVPRMSVFRAGARVGF